MKIKRGELRTLHSALESLNQDMVPSTRYSLKRDKEKIESEYKQYQKDNDSLIEKYGKLTAAVVQQIDGQRVEVGTADRIFNDGNVKWKSGEHYVELESLDLRKIKFVAESDVKEKAYTEELKEMDSTEIDIDLKLISMNELKRYNEHGEKVNINLPAAADPLLGVIIVEDDRQGK